MKVMILGAGGREHALAAHIAASPDCEQLIVAPGNGGTAQLATNLPLDILDAAAVSAAAREWGIDLVVIGPEGPLVAGVADVLRDKGIAVFGPGAEGAMLEGSKRHAKEFMARHALPTASWAAFSSAAEALDWLAEHPAPVVVKADGLAAGKGVTVAATDEEAQAAIREAFDGRFGDAASQVLLEECLEGPECSLLVFCDGRRMLPMVPAQDHKRVFDGDLGPNTGGMGVYSPVPVVDAQAETAMLEIMARAVAGLGEEGIDYRGVLYGGFMLTSDGPKLLEFNARFGDPETQVILPRLQTDLLSVLSACACGDASQLTLVWKSDWALGVVLASAGYPGEYQRGQVITGIREAASLPDVSVFHAGTRLDRDGKLLTDGGRVLNVVALGDSLAEAQRRAYEAVERINFTGMQFRHDIGSRGIAALQSRAASPLKV